MACNCPPSSASFQLDDLVLMSSKTPWITIARRRLGWHLRKDGLRVTLRKIAILCGKKVGLCPAFNAVAPPPHVSSRISSECLNLQPGEWVEVRSEDEIRTTLDSKARTRGLFFMDEMRQYCGRKFRVHKRVSRMILESTGEVRAVKNTVLLENAFCDGVGLACDRSCFHFWREAWLKRVEKQ